VDQCFKQKPGKLHRGFILQAHSGWLELFRTWHNINFRFLSGESAAVDMAVVEDWKSKLRQVINKYPLSNQFSADETGLFY
jgi:hypothetical protein